MSPMASLATADLEGTLAVGIALSGGGAVLIIAGRRRRPRRDAGLPSEPDGSGDD